MWCVFACGMYFRCSVHFICSVFICGVSLCVACILYVVCILYPAACYLSIPTSQCMPPSLFTSKRMRSSTQSPRGKSLPRPAGAHSRPSRSGWTLPCPGSARGVSEQARIRLLLTAGLLTVPSGGFLCS